jgi:flagellar motor switch protein FliG
MAGSHHLTGPERAAVIVEALGPLRAAPVVSRLAESDLLKLLNLLARGVNVSEADRAAVIEDACQRLGRRDVLAVGGLEYVRELLAHAFGREVADEWIRRLQGDHGPQPFRLLAEARAEDVAELLRDEHPQVAALVLSHLPADLAAGVLEQWPAEEQADLLRRIARVEPVLPRALEVLEARLLQRFVERGGGYRRPHGLDAAVAMLNKVERATERQVLKGLADVDPPLAETIKSRMFLFEDLASLSPRVLQYVLRRLNKKDLAVALRLVHPENQAIFFANMGKEAAEEVRTEMVETGPVPVREAEAAQSRIVAAIRAMEEAEEIELTRGTEELV